MSLVGSLPKLRFQRCRKRCIHFLAAALRAGRQEAARRCSSWSQAMAKAHRFSQTNWGGGATPCALFWSPTQRSRRASSTNLRASARAPRGMSSLQSSHIASVSTGVCRKRSSIARMQAATSSSITRAYFRSVASAIEGPHKGSWQKANVATWRACSRCFCCLDRCFCACRCRRLRSAVTLANPAASSSMARREVGKEVSDFARARRRAPFTSKETPAPPYKATHYRAPPKQTQDTQRNVGRPYPADDARGSQS